MASKIGIVLALDGEKEFTSGMKAAKESAKLCGQELKNLEQQYSGSANTIEALTKKQEQLSKQQEAYSRELQSAKSGQENAVNNYKKAGERLEELKKQLEEAKQAMTEMAQAGENSGKAYESQAKKVEQLEKAVERQKEQQNKASINITKWDTAVSKAQGDVNKANGALQKNGKYLDEASRSADGCATSIDKMGKEAKESSTEVSNLGNSVKDAFINQAARLATNAGVEIGKKAIEALKAAVEVGSAYEQAMSEVAAISGATGSSLDAMGEKAKALGASTKFSATEVANGFKYMSLAGWDTNQMLSSIDGIVNLAAASEMELGQASDMVTDYLSAFGLSAEYAGQMADEMAFAQANSNTTVQMLGDSFSNCAADMHAAGQDMETVTSFLEAMANQGTKGAEAGTALSAMMRDISQKMEGGRIQIGKTTVSVKDSEGNFRDLTDILRDVEKATEGMGTAEKRTALQQTFTARSMKAVNEILTEGVDKVAGYEEALRSADGAAADMAATMQDNFAGARTRLGSALEGLGIAVYETFRDPLTSATDLLAGVVGTIGSAVQGFADAMHPAQSELQGFLDVVAQTGEQATAHLEASQSTIKTMGGDIGNLEHYATIIEELNGKENLNEYQKYQLKGAVEALKGEIPELASAYDDETGKINLQEGAIRDLIKARKDEIIQNATAKAQQEALEAVTTAALEKNQAAAAKSAAEGRKKALEEEKKEILNLASEYVALESEGNYRTDEQNKRMEEIGRRMKDLGYNSNEAQAIIQSDAARVTAAIGEEGKAVEEADKRLQEAITTEESAKTAYEEVGQAVGETVEEVEEYVRSATEAQLASEGAADAAEDAGESSADLHRMNKQAAKSAEELADAEDDVSEATAGAGEAAKGASDDAKALRNELHGLKIDEDKLAEARKKQAEHAAKQAEQVKEAYKDSASSIREAWDSLRENASQTLTFSISTEFDGGDDLTTETMNANLQSQIDGYTQYYENLQKLRQAMNEGIITPEFFSHLEEQGTAAANEINHIAWTLENQENGVEQVQGISDKWTEALNWQDAISAVIAGDQAVLADGLKSMGSTDAEFSSLRTAVDEGLTDTGTKMREKIDSLISTAQEVGAKIPEGLEDSLKSGDISSGEVAEQLESAIQGAISETAAIAKESGAEVSENLTQSISDALKSGDMSAITDAYTQLINSLSDAAAQNVPTDEQKAAGEEAGNAFAEGVTSTQAQAEQAATTLRESVKTTLSADIGAYTSIGYNMSAGVAQGIANGQSMAINAAANMAAQTLARAKAELDIHSPSRKFINQVGKQIGAGVAFGVKQSTPLSTGAAKKMSNDTLTAATAWLKKYSKSHKVGKQATMYFWGQVTAATKSGTKAWEKALQNAEKAAAKAGFGVSKTKTTGSGKNKKTVKKTAEEYAKDVLSAAQDYFNVLTMNEDMSIKAELKYWQKVQKSLKKGTTAYVSAAQTIKSLKEKIGGFDVASDLIDSFQIYQDMSEKAVMDYWDTIRKQYTAGTEDRLKADEKYLSAKKAWTEKLKELEDDYQEKVKETTQKYTDALEDRVEAIAGAFDLFDEFESESATGQELLFNMQSQAEGYRFWMEQLEALTSRGILSGDLLSALGEKGPTDAAALYALNSLTDEDLRKYQDAYNEKMDLSRKQATKDKDDLKKTVEKELADLKTKYASDVASVNKTIDSGLLTYAGKIKTIADDQTTAIVNAIKGGNAAASKTAAGGASSGSGSTKTAANATPSTASIGGIVAVGSSASEAVSKANIKLIINSGSSRKKTLTAADKKKSDLYQYLASNYGRTGTNALYQKLAAALGLKMSSAKTTTAAEKNKILKALKAKGLQGGTKDLHNFFAWMDEEGIGSEMIVRRSDGARLNTSVRPGDAIVPAANTDNLWGWSRIDPQAFLRQLQAVDIAALNAKLLMAPQMTASGGTATMTGDILTQMLNLLSEYLPEMRNARSITLDGRQVAEGLSDAMSTELAMRSRRKR